jgi:hypothetical protein
VKQCKPVPNINYGTVLETSGNKKKKKKEDVATSPKKYLVATFSFSQVQKTNNFFYFGPIFHVNLNEVNI